MKQTNPKQGKQTEGRKQQTKHSRNEGKQTRNKQKIKKK